MYEHLIKARCRLWEAPPKDHHVRSKCSSKFDCNVVIGPLEPSFNCTNGIIYLDWIAYILVNKNFVEIIDGE